MSTYSRIVFHGLLILFLWFICTPLQARLNIEIFGGGTERIPIAIVPFADENRLQQRITDVVAADLQRSGLFRLIDPTGLTPSAPAEVVYSDWTNRGANALVIGRTILMPGGQVEVQFRLMDVARQAQLTGLAAVVPVTQLRAVAHRIADIIYEALTGDVGVFSTRIAYVKKQGNRYALQIADSDGYNEHSIIEYTEPIISPAWSPDGGQIAYVSFENKKPVVYVQTLATRQRRAVANFSGSNSAPAWSPDGKKLAVVLSLHGGSQIYLINADGSGLQRLTRSSGIDTEPSFSPDGRYIIFTSDRGGSPQIYRIPVTATESTAAERLTFEGNYNVSPDYSHDGKSFTFIHRHNGRFNVAVQDIATRQVQLLTNSQLDESPSFAPNGRMILYATDIGGHGILSAVSRDGQTRQHLSAQTGDIREPAWGPLPKQK
ncbi:Tol-Pal system beta propeller repeat protein TolB [Nitrosomonas sp.]|uniref:Tol-Pal system beta propeller repeat protein TolB n=1 Tax=Nitrosomonas sp. TaxID=42353 RepID=UPI0020812470|nr:Tol-Pal system beta propeller repeat protein TolB [Nitrosomonas sp.]GJL74995.1 MAG: protein TolB [Nitrosomonas sp.]